MASAGKEWIKTDETAKQMLSRIFIERPFLALPPPLHTLPLRAGNVVEIVGPSSSAKTHVLMQATISCILPKKWKGVEYGGMERKAAFVDLDCRFDVLRFSHLLKNRIIHSTTKDERPDTECDEELFAACMGRFLYVRCYDSFEFIATLKTMTNQFKKEKERQSDGVLMLVFDSIGAFYWMDRAWSSSSLGSNRNMEIKPSINVSAMKDSVTPSRALPHYDHMPSVWQSFVSHRIQVHPTDDYNSQPIYLTEWLLPSINSSVKFTINDLEKAAPVLAGLKQPIAVAKVNADKYRSIASKHDIDAFPTLLIFMHGVPTEYYGPRKADILVRFLRKFIAPDVAILDSDIGVREFVKDVDAHFPIFIGFGINESVISDLAVKYKKKAWFSVAKDFTEEIMEYYEFYKTPALVALHESYNERNIFYGPFEDTFLEDYVKQSLLPLVLPINQDTLKLLKDDQRKIALTVVEDESNDKSEKLIKLLKAAASANRDLVFGYVGFKQFEEFAESFGYTTKTKLPVMVIWDGNEDYLSVIGSESIEEEDQGSQITKFLEGYREGKVIKKQISSPSFLGYLSSVLGISTFYIAIIVLFVLILIIQLAVRVGGDQGDGHSSSTSQPEITEGSRSGDKED